MYMEGCCMLVLACRCRPAMAISSKASALALRRLSANSPISASSTSSAGIDGVRRGAGRAALGLFNYVSLLQQRKGQEIYRMFAHNSTSRAAFSGSRRLWVRAQLPWHGPASKRHGGSASALTESLHRL